MRLSTFTAILSFLCFSCGQAHITRPIPINEKQAVRLAEDFIKRNCYTTSNIDTTQVKLAFESLEYLNDTEEIIAKRHNSLKSEAYGYRYDDKKWHIAFQLSDSKILAYQKMGIETNQAKIGRAVTMDSLGHNIKVEHQDTMLDYYKRK